MVNRKGSTLRAAEEKLAKKAGGDSYFAWGHVNPLPALDARIADKISSAASYDRNQFDELWLLIVGQIPKPGAVAATFVVSNFLNISKLNQHFDGMLRGSVFEKVYLYLVLDQVLYEWSSSDKWRLVSGSPSMSGGSTPSLKEILSDQEWLRDPTGKARVEAQKATAELVEKRARAEK